MDFFNGLLYAAFHHRQTRARPPQLRAPPTPGGVGKVECLQHGDRVDVHVQRDGGAAVSTVFVHGAAGEGVQVSG